MNIVIDIGNSSSKAGIFSNSGELVFKNTYPELNVDEVLKLRNDHKEVNYGIFSSVKEVSQRFVDAIKSKLDRLIILDENTPLPLIDRYQTPETLGKDRIAAAAGAIFSYPDQDILIIDAGTAMTIDFVNRRKEFIGGIISPGLEMRFKALNYYTSKLPLLQTTDIEGITGKSTEEAITLGVQNGIIFEIEEYIEKYSKHYDKLITVITGGDAEFLAKRLKNPIFVKLDLVLTGLNQILNYNVR